MGDSHAQHCLLLTWACQYREEKQENDCGFRRRLSDISELEAVYEAFYSSHTPHPKLWQPRRFLQQTEVVGGRDMGHLGACGGFTCVPHALNPCALTPCAVPLAGPPSHRGIGHALFIHGQFSFMI